MTRDGNDLTVDVSPWQRRWHPLLSQWVVVSATSAARPWSGQMADTKAVDKPQHDPGCYLCPRVERAGGVCNPDYRGVHAFDNDFPSLSPEAPVPATSGAPELFDTAQANGCCRVLCWSERHDATLASLSEAEMLEAARLWQSEYRELSSRSDIKSVLIFENKGQEIGVSNLHPHGQIYATDFVTDTATRMREAQARYARERDGASLLQALIAHPVVESNLIVERGSHWLTLVPFAARFPYETWIVPRRHLSSLLEVDDTELAELAAMYQRQVRRYDLLFQRSAPNVSLWHNAPCDGAEDNPHWCFHVAYHPPLRDPEKMKFLAGFESGSNNIVNPVQPERAAEQLRDIDPGAWAG